MQGILKTLLLITFLLFTVNSKRIRREHHHHQNIDLNRMKCVDPYLTEDKLSFEKLTKKSCCCAFIGSGWISNENNYCDLCPLMIDRYGDISKDYNDLCGNGDNGVSFTFY